VNAPAPVNLRMYDGSSQAVHPDVLFAPSGFGGYQYWMAVTPYPYCNDRLENPSLRASHDGLHWVLPSGIPDPVVEAPLDADEHHADPDLVLANERLFMFYMTTNEHRRRTRFSVISTVDGYQWTGPEIIHDNLFGVSPAVVERDGRWRMWYVNYDSDARAADSCLLLREGNSPTNLGDSRACQLEIPGHVLWHLDVIESHRGFEGLLAAFPRGSTSSRCRLFHASSADGAAWTLTTPRPIITASRLGWDDRVIYRSTFLKEPNGEYRVWYTGGSWSRSWGIGYLHGPLTALSPDPRAAMARRTGSLLGDVAGAMRYAGGRVLPRSLVTRLRRAFP
jgi:hypothetical protein